MDIMGFRDNNIHQQIQHQSWGANYPSFSYPCKLILTQKAPSHLLFFFLFPDFHKSVCNWIFFHSKINPSTANMHVLCIEHKYLRNIICFSVLRTDIWIILYTWTICNRIQDKGLLRMFKGNEKKQAPRWEDENIQLSFPLHSSKYENINHIFHSFIRSFAWQSHLIHHVQKYNLNKIQLGLLLKWL